MGECWLYDTVATRETMKSSDFASPAPKLPIFEVSFFRIGLPVNKPNFSIAFTPDVPRMRRW